MMMEVEGGTQRAHPCSAWPELGRGKKVIEQVIGAQSPARGTFLPF